MIAPWNYIKKLISSVLKIGPFEKKNLYSNKAFLELCTTNLPSKTKFWLGFSLEGFDQGLFLMHQEKKQNNKSITSRIVQQITILL